MENLENILNQYRKKKYFFYNHPKEFPLENYQLAIEEIIAKLSKIKDVCSIYNLTGISTPGISDLDLIVVLKNDFQSSQGKDYASGQFSPLAQYTLTHPLILQRKDLFSKLYYRHYDRWESNEENTLYCIYGQKIEPEKINRESLNIFQAYYLAGILFTKIPRDFLRSFISGRINVRGLLQVIYGLRYSINLLSQISGKKPQSYWLKFVKEFGNFRQRWFGLDNSRYQKLINYLIGATIVSFQLIEEFGNFLKEKNLIPAYRSSKNKKFLALYTGSKLETIFYDHQLLSFSEALKIDFELAEKQKLRARLFPSILLLPSEFVGFLWQISQASGGKRGKYITDNLIFLEKPPEVVIPLEIREREEVFNTHTNFLLKGKAISTNPGGEELFGFYTAGFGFSDQLNLIIRNFRSWLVKRKMFRYLKR
jgi:hypothetical protein